MSYRPCDSWESEYLSFEVGNGNVTTSLIR